MVDSLDDLLPRVDYLSLHIPKTDQTANLMDAERIAAMKDGAYLICAARGGIVDEEALYQALVSGKLAGGRPGRFRRPNRRAPAPLMTNQNFICTPHLGASTEEAQVNVARAAAEQIRDFLNGTETRYALNTI